MRFKGTIFLSAFLVLVGLYLFYVELPDREEEQELALNKGKLYAFTENDITHMIIRRPDGEIELEHFPGHPSAPWRIFRPVETVADANAADELASRLVALKASRLVEAKPSELKDFGLDPPTYTVIMTLPNNDTELLEIGGPNLTGSDLYVKKGMGTSLYLAPAGIQKSLDKDLMAWRRKEIFPFSSFDIGWIRIESDEGFLQASKEAGGRWSMEISPSAKTGEKRVKGRGDREEISNLLGTIVNLRGGKFIDIQKEAKLRRFGPRLMKITLKIGEIERDGTFYQDKADPGVRFVVTATYDPIYQISERALEGINQPFQTYRDKRVFPLDRPGQIEEIKIAGKDRALHLKKKKGLWWLEEENPKEVTEIEVIPQFLTVLYNLRTDAFLDGLDPSSPESELAQPAMTIHLSGKEGEPLGQVTLGKIEGEQIYANSISQPYPFFLKKGVLDVIPPREALFQDPEETTKEQLSLP